jgi:hypothetical protein
MRQLTVNERLRGLAFRGARASVHSFFCSFTAIAADVPDANQYANKFYTLPSQAKGHGLSV